MGRALKRLAERRERLSKEKGKISLSPKDISALKQNVTKDATSYSAEALMTCFALAQHRLYGFGKKRILKTLHYIDCMMGSVLEGSITIEDYKKQLEDETGVIVRCD